MMKNVKGGKGLFASIMVVTRQFVGKKGSISLEEMQLLCTLRHIIYFR
ncbi:hypothetical protein Goshw_027608 [Gossypium schwendimanii]|uniref:Uncharacterized protein n=1 Tax=Gossypium schwendimanii TaxID=34291 RepID=A0A7J9MMF0_GOSSC|nr:hypothetical protein [Gossypium schwendimanii]